MKLISDHFIQGEQGSPGAAGQKGPPGPMVRPSINKNTVMDVVLNIQILIP